MINSQLTSKPVVSFGQLKCWVKLDCNKSVGFGLLLSVLCDKAPESLAAGLPGQHPLVWQLCCPQASWGERRVCSRWSNSPSPYGLGASLGLWGSGEAGS